jgi:2-amino-4-hydroxy-6-hydroxymethyldihydropteridine diphosphokinase
LSASEPPKPITYIGLGSNIKPGRHLPRAVRALGERAELLAVSSAWRSAAVGGGPDFLNAAVKLTTALDAEELKAQLLRPIEAELGRVRGADRYAPRTIDLDILIYDGQELDPQIWDLAYLAVPLSEIAGTHASPVTGETLAEAATRLREAQKIKRSSVKLK